MNDPVNNPSHYKSGGIQVIDVIEAFELNFRLANVIKYVLRAGRKGDALMDLRKAKYYLDREIAKREAATAGGEIRETLDVDITSREDIARRMAKVFFDTSISKTGGVFGPEVASEKQEYNG